MNASKVAMQLRVAKARAQLAPSSPSSPSSPSHRSLARSPARFAHTQLAGAIRSHALTAFVDICLSARNRRFAWAERGLTPSGTYVTTAAPGRIAIDFLGTFAGRRRARLVRVQPPTASASSSPIWRRGRVRERRRLASARGSRRKQALDPYPGALDSPRAHEGQSRGEKIAVAHPDGSERSPP